MAERSAPCRTRRPRSGNRTGAELPLIAWGETRARTRRRLGALRRRAALVALVAAALGATLVFPPSPRLVWNASASAPLGLYMVRPGAPVARGDMVVVRLPEPARRLAAQRRYLPANVPAIKRVAAVAGARVCASGAHILIDGKRVAARLAADRHGRPLPWWHGCRTLGSGDVFLLMAGSRESFDGRYFGVTRRADIVGKARLLWSPHAGAGQ